MKSQEIRQLLESGKFEGFLESVEDSLFEAKRKDAYDLNTAVGRYELAKDVSSFANSEGGFLVVGLTTETLVEQNTDKVIALDLCLETEFNAVKTKGAITDYVHPEIKGLTVKFVAHPSRSPLGLGVIEIPNQLSERKYFLTARVVEDGQSLRQIVFGLSRREKSFNEPLSISALYEMMQKGKSKQSETLARVEGKIDAVLSAVGPKSAGESASQKLDRRVEDLRGSK